MQTLAVNPQIASRQQADSQATAQDDGINFATATFNALARLTFTAAAHSLVTDAVTESVFANTDLSERPFGLLYMAQCRSDTLQNPHELAHYITSVDSHQAGLSEDPAVVSSGKVLGSFSVHQLLSQAKESDSFEPTVTFVRAPAGKILSPGVQDLKAA